MTTTFDGDADTRMQSALSAMEPRVGAKLQGARFLPSIAMPLHLALDGAPYLVTTPDSSEPAGFLKVFESEAAPFVDFAATVAASRQAADVGIAPALLDVDEKNAAILYAFLPAEWRMVRRDDLDDPNVLSKVIAAKRSLHRSAKLPFTRSPFETIGAHLAAMQPVGSPDGVSLADARNVRELKPWIARIENAFRAAGSDSAPVHGENTLSNVMLNADGDIRLVDFDRAANADPLSDLGAFCLETCAFAEDVDRAVEMYAGAADAAIVARVKLHMIVDDFLWGCWATLNHFTSARSGTVEFYKYGQNRFLRAKYWLSRFDTDALIRRM